MFLFHIHEQCLFKILGCLKEMTDIVYFIIWKFHIIDNAIFNFDKGIKP